MNHKQGLLLIVAALVGLAACGSDGPATVATETLESSATADVESSTVPERGRPEVVRSVVAHETTRDIVVWAPAGEEALPVIYLVHGLDGTPETVEQLGTRLAASGHVVFAPTWVMGESMIRDLECGYRFVRSIAADHGGDLALPVTSVGHSAGANLVIGGAVSGALLGPQGSFDECFAGAPRPGLVVAIAPCTYDEELPAAGEQDVRVVVLSAEEDTVCAPQLQSDTVSKLLAAGYGAELVSLAGANHWTPAFRDLANGRIVDVSDSAAGELTLQVIVEAIEEMGQ